MPEAGARTRRSSNAASAWASCARAVDRDDRASSSRETVETPRSTSVWTLLNSASVRATASRACASCASRSAGAMRAMAAPASIGAPLRASTVSTVPAASARTGVDSPGRTSPSIVSTRSTGWASERATSTDTGSGSAARGGGASATSSSPNMPLAIQPTSASTNAAAIQPERDRRSPWDGGASAEAGAGRSSSITNRRFRLAVRGARSGFAGDASRKGMGSGVAGSEDVGGSASAGGF